MEEKVYICDCGKECKNSQSFNAHQSKCQVHIVKKYGQEYWDNLKLKLTQNALNSHEKHSKNVQLAKELEWNSAEHFCEHCGKQFYKKFGSGRFCCISCANSKNHSEETKQKIRSGVKSYYINNIISPKTQCDHKISHSSNKRHIKCLEEYLAHPKYCQFCGKELPYQLRSCKTCCMDCKNKLASITMKEKNRINGVHNLPNNRYKYGTYKGIECDSAWELAYVMYSLDNGIKIERNRESFEYTIKNNTRLYFPDFKVDGEYIEIKGYYREKDFEKIQQFPSNLTLNVIDKKLIKPYIKYAQKTYGIDYWKFYDKDKKSCNDIV